ncbi:glycosyltransferase [Leucobacter denitrificans]|uniref:Glycosyltransferase n=1 Tax=Leucobacter denitrificans TaxID=683042 RepID=A0A7G9S3J3_9MICO|nr:glycosyltransferase [Leucobacter denitrificans]QNN62418.1 glycosyltransferase [Leucobacter denitrificans]
MPTPLLFKLEGVADEATTAALESLTAVQHAQLNSALNFHSLTNPAARIEARLVVGSPSRMPALTDESTIDGSAAGDATEVATITIRSTAIGSPGQDRELRRTIRLGHAEASPASTESPAPQSLPRRVYRELERRAPLLVDAVRETIMNRREQAISSRLPRYPGGPAHASPEVIDAWVGKPLAPPANAPRAVLFGLHWLQTGGAERWAVESIQLAKDAGFVPIVVTDQNSVHPWSIRPELEGALIISLSFSQHEHKLDLSLAHALLENYDIRGIVIHHSEWLYRSLPWIRSVRPNIPVIDSLHIVEYLGGGYPGYAAHYDEHIDTHHVISPQLVQWLTRVQGVDQEKLALAPLTALTVEALGEFKPHDPAKPLVIAFVGRLSRQKRPDVFLGLVRRLRKQGVRFRAILHGDGELRNLVDGLIAQMKLSDVIEQRFEDVPVNDTLSEADVLIVTSINEGLTLTTFEAIAAGIPVISTDVGSQSTIVQGDALLPRPARPFIKGASALIANFERDEALRESIWDEQQERVKEFSALPTAHEWMKGYFESWQA